MSRLDDIHSDCRDYLDSLSTLLEKADPEKHAAHSRRVGAMAECLYRHWISTTDPESETLEEDAVMIRTAATLHDIGKCRIEADLLNNRRDLTDDQYARVKYHTVASIELLANGSALSLLAAEIALNHHEKWDGTGYPGFTTDYPDGKVINDEGKKENDIPFAARLTAIVDVYDALLSARSYKEAWEESAAYDYVLTHGGTHFDPALVELFEKYYDEIRNVRQAMIDADQV